MSCMISCSVWRCYSEISLPDLIVISWEVWASTHALSTEVVVMKKWVISVYDLETAEREETKCSLIVQLDSACITCLI